jgi:hypothetical protein
MKDLILEHKDDFRMYGLVPYNISSIQQGIQFGHALQEYNNYFIDNLINDEKEKEAFESWRLFGKTFIILNGGTTNDRLIDGEYFGSLNKYKEELDKNGILNAIFKEPDLGEQLTAVVFLVPKQVYNKKQYPDFLEYAKMNSEFNYNFFEEIKEEYESGLFSNSTNENVYKSWVGFIGGEKNVFLREFLKNFRLA